MPAAQLTDEERAISVATPTELTWDALRAMRGLKRKIALGLYHPATELAIVGAIVLSVSLLVVELILGVQSSHEVDTQLGIPRGTFMLIDVALSIVFIIEYALRLWIAPARAAFVRTHIIDLIALLPVLRILRAGRALRLLRILRVVRLLRVGTILSGGVSLGGELRQQSGENMIIGLYLVISVTFGSLGIMYFEAGAGSGFDSFEDALWWCVVTLTTVGYGDRFPVTTGGRIVAGVLMFVGLSFYALLTGVLSTALINRARKKEKGQVDVRELSDHIVICGWNEHARQIAADTLSEESRSAVVVITEMELPEGFQQPRLLHVRGDATTNEALERAGIERARAAVVLAEERQGAADQDVDARTILGALALRRLAPEIHLIVELLQRDNRYHAINAGADEVVSTEAYTGTMLSYAARFPGMSVVFEDVFDVRTGAHFEERRVSPDEVGQSVAELVASAVKKGVFVVGVRRDQEVTLAPESERVVSEGDKLVILSRRMR